MMCSQLYSVMRFGVDSLNSFSGWGKVDFELMFSLTLVSTEVYVLLDCCCSYLDTSKRLVDMAITMARVGDLRLLYYPP